MTSLTVKHKVNVSEDSSESGADLAPQPDRKKPRVASGDDLTLNVPETTVSGQMKLNPHFTPEQARSAAKKEYNRRNSARSRVRNKKMVEQLQEKCAELSQREQALMRENDILRAQVEFFKQKMEAVQQQQRIQTMLSSSSQQQQQQAQPPVFPVSSSRAALAAALLDRKYF